MSCRSSSLPRKLLSPGFSNTEDSLFVIRDKKNTWISGVWDKKKRKYQVSETHHRLELQLDDVSMSESPESEQAARGISSILVFSIIFLAIMDHGDLDHGFTVEITKKTLQIQFHVSFDNHCLSIDFHYFEQSLIYGMAKKRILWWETGCWLLQVSLLMITSLRGSWWWRWEIFMKMLGGEISWLRWSS